MLMKEPSTISQQTYPKNVRTVFMQVCIFNRGACFGLGEHDEIFFLNFEKVNKKNCKHCKFIFFSFLYKGERMYNRRVVSISPTRCLLVPRYWLLKHNRANIWERVKLFMDSKYPTSGQLFKKFVNNRRY